MLQSVQKIERFIQERREADVPLINFCYLWPLGHCMAI